VTKCSVASKPAGAIQTRLFERGIVLSFMLGATSRM
jgi:hypothetical protein